MENEIKESLEDWKQSLENLSFEERAVKIKDKILESDELDKQQRDFFNDTFQYVMNLYHHNKPLDTNLLRIHYGITQGTSEYPQKIQQFIRMLMLLSLCGFQFSMAGDNQH
jgi:hypothetical protein